MFPTSSLPDPQKVRISALDLLRSVAIMIVFFWHYQQYGAPGWVVAIGSFGWTGVDLFFVLSGYLIGSQLMRQVAETGSIGFKDFYIRRFFRILPAYLFILLLYFTIPGFRERGELPPLWKFLTFTQNFGLDLSKESTFSHAWSLCIEEQFYLCLPLLLYFITTMRLSRVVPWLFVSIFLLGFCTRYYNWQHFVAPLIDTENGGGIAYYRYIYYPTYNRLDGLLAGVAIAAILCYKPQLWQTLSRYSNFILLAGIALLGLCYWLCADMISLSVAVFGYPLVSLAYGLIVLAAISPSSVLSRMQSTAFATIASLAYCIYLTHKQLNHLTRTLLSGSFDDNGLPMFVICLFVAIAGGALLHFCIEKPFIVLRKRLV